MLKQWIPAVKPEKEELEKRLNAAQEELGRLQMQIKEHKLPVLVLIEGWGAAGKGSTIGGIIKNIDPRFFKVASMSAPTEEEKRKPFLYRYFVKIPEAGKFEHKAFRTTVDGQRLSGVEALFPDWKKGTEEAAGRTGRQQGHCMACG